MSGRKEYTVMQRLLRRPLNWAIERYFDKGVFFGYGFLEDMERIGRSTEKRHVTSGVAGYLILQTSDAGAARQVTTVEGLTIQGKPMGDWRVTIEQIAAPDAAAPRCPATDGTEIAKIETEASGMNKGVNK